MPRTFHVTFSEDDLEFETIVAAPNEFRAIDKAWAMCPIGFTQFVEISVVETTDGAL